MKHQKCMQKFSHEQYRINYPSCILHFFIIEIKSDTSRNEYYFVGNLVEKKVSLHYVESRKLGVFEICSQDVNKANFEI